MTTLADVTDAQRREVAVEDVRFVVHRAAPARGKGVPVLLLHGVPETSLSWRDLVPRLATDRVVLAPDLKGLGESEVVGSYDVPTLVRELAALVLHEVDGPVDVVGHDWGGVLAQGLNATRPDLVRRMVVINAPYQRVNPVRAAHIPFLALPGLPDVALGLSRGRFVDLGFRHAWKAPERLPSDVLAAYRRAYAPRARQVAMMGYYRAAARGQVVARIPGLPSPERVPKPAPGRHLVVWGAADPVLPVSLGEDVVRSLGAETSMVTLPGIGHFAPEEAPEQVGTLVADFLRSA